MLNNVSDNLSNNVSTKTLNNFSNGLLNNRHKELYARTLLHALRVLQDFDSDAPMTFHAIPSDSVTD